MVKAVGNLDEGADTDIDFITHSKKPEVLKVAVGQKFDGGVITSHEMAMGISWRCRSQSEFNCSERCSARDTCAASLARGRKL